MTLNLWGYTDWGNRKDSIINLVQNFQPDIIALQEVHTNLLFSDYPQSDFIANHTQYQYRIFAPNHAKIAQINTEDRLFQNVSHGLALLSRFPIISSETYFLNLHPSHPEPCTVLFCKIDTDCGAIDICNVHFGNNDIVSDLQLKELLALCNTRHIKPIILGDLNIFNLTIYQKDLLKDYIISTNIKPYISMARDKGTLDYVLSTSRYIFKSIICPDLYVSDHRAVIATLEISV